MTATTTLASPPRLELAGDPVSLCAALVDIPSVSGSEGPLADLVAAALREQAPHLRVERDGAAVIARTTLGRPRRVVVAGHLDTVPIAGNVPGRLEAGRLHGCGSTDMKGGIAVALHLAATVRAPVHDVTWLFYDCEEVAASRNGLGRLQRNRPEWLAGDFALLMEPTNAVVEAGCQGTLRAVVTVPGVRAHTARNWIGTNAIHAAAPVLAALASYDARRVVIDGCHFREGLSAVAIEGGVAGNVVPDVCRVTVNYRFAPDRTEAQAADHVRGLFPDLDVVIVDSAAGALPGLGSPAAAAFVSSVGAAPTAKLGWTDVARFAALGMPAVNFGPGDPLIAHTAGESVDTAQITAAAETLRRYLEGRTGYAA